MKRETLRRITFNLIVVTLVSIWGLMVFLSCIGLFVYITHTPIQEISPKQYEYPMFSRREGERGNTTQVSIITMERKLDPYESIFQPNGRKGYVVISNFGETLYQCRGRCICEGRRTLTILMRVIPYVVTAVSSSIAYKYAKDYFEDVCEHELKDSCTKESIRSEVDDCAYGDIINHYDDLNEKGEGDRSIPLYLYRKMYPQPKSCKPHIFGNGRKNTL